MTTGAPTPRARFDREKRILDMTNKNQERGEKRGVLSTGRAKDLDTEGADADVAEDEDEG